MNFFPMPNIKSLESIYSNYETAMNRRRHGMALEEDRFINHVFYHCKYERNGKSFIFGSEKDGIFFPSHFAPNTLREGLGLIKKLKSKKTCFIVTEDLIPMLRKTGFFILPFKIRVEFRGDIEIKQIAISKLSLIPKLMLFVKEYLTTGSIDTFIEREDDKSIWDDLPKKEKVSQKRKPICYKRFSCPKITIGQYLKEH